MDYFYLKALHIIFIVTWFSGLFYQVRLFIYNREANDKAEPDKSVLQQQFQQMSRRLLFGITWHSAVFTLIFGFFLLHSYMHLASWMIVKLILVGLLYLYH
ncbi:MAG: CopD family protein, partial [Bacteroidetes bacterium]|nr:CopD family protein [Bacteroidota bacterium]